MHHMLLKVKSELRRSLYGDTLIDFHVELECDKRRDRYLTAGSGPGAAHLVRALIRWGSGVGHVYLSRSSKPHLSQVASFRLQKYIKD